MDNQLNSPENKDNGNGATSIDVVSRPSLTDISPTTSTPNLNRGSSTPNNPALSAPAGTVSGGGGKSKLMPILLTILLVLIFVGGIFGVYEWQHKKVTNQDAQITLLQNQINLLNNKVVTEEKSAVSINTPASTSTTTSTTTTVYKVPGLGVEFTVPYILSDLTSAVNSGNTVANLSTQTLTDLNSGCTASATAGLALGNINKGNGKFAAATGVTLIKQYPTYYISYTAAPKPCSTITQVNSLTTTLTTALKSSFSTIQTTSN